MALAQVVALLIGELDLAALAEQGLDLEPEALTPDHVRAYLAWSKGTQKHSAAIRARRIAEHGKKNTKPQSCC